MSGHRLFYKNGITLSDKKKYLSEILLKLRKKLQKIRKSLQNICVLYPAIPQQPLYGLLRIIIVSLYFRWKFLLKTILLQGMIKELM
jgi:hypothetical protein